MDGQKTPVEETFNKYKESLKPDIEKAVSDKRIAQKGYKDAVRSRQFKNCSFKKAKAAIREYEGLMNHVVATAHQDVVEINTSINKYIKYTGDIKTAFDSVVESLRTAKKSLSEVESTANFLAEVLENSDQSEEQKWLKKEVPNFAPTVKKFAGDTGWADKANDLADDAFEIAVKVIGINASINVESLIPLSTQLQTDITALKEDVKGNMTFSQGEKQKAQQTLDAQNQAQSGTRSIFARARLNLHSLKSLESFVSHPHCDEGSDLQKKTLRELNRLADAVEDSFA
ncbi:MAG: hypothetical protein JNL70_25780 [Saprospiraceae bacterium]|nr:hypothetical protein [Saprospiraceae bacterium]